MSKNAEAANPKGRKDITKQVAHIDCFQRHLKKLGPLLIRFREEMKAHNMTLIIYTEIESGEFQISAMNEAKPFKTV